MLPFFRKIRWRHARDNQFFKYSRYAIGEIVLVVIGILIALQINNWNEDRKDKEVLKNQLISLKEAFHEDLENLESSKGYDGFRFYSMEKLLEYAGSPMTLPEEDLNSIYERIPFDSVWQIAPYPKKENREFINEAFSHSGRHRPVVINRKAIEELESTGMYSKFENKELKSKINQYYSHIDSEVLWLDDKLFFLETNWENSLFEDGIIYVDVVDVDNPIDHIRNNPYRLSLLRNLARMAFYRTHIIQNRIDELEELLAMIDQEISSFR